MAKQKKQYWLHRINGGKNGMLLSHPLLNNHNLLSIGWSFLSSETNAKNIRECGVSAIKDLYLKMGKGFTKNIYCLFNFIAAMNQGDIIIVPLNAKINIYRIIDNVVFTNETIPHIYLEELNVSRDDKQLIVNHQTIDLGFYRKVELVAQGISRSQLEEKLYKKTRTRLTNLNISDTEDLIDLLIFEQQQKRKKEGSWPIEYSQLIEKLKSSLEKIETNQSFDERLTNVFKDMHSFIKNGVQFEYAPYGNKNQKKTSLIVSYDYVQNNIDDNVRVIKDVIKDYMRGDLFASIKKLNNWLESIPNNTLPYAPIRKNYVYYRTRLKGNTVFNEKDLFHVPFCLRGSVSTNRYSLPGYPCLYLGKSIYVCWEEMRRPALSDFAMSAFKAQEKIFLLDMRLRKRMYSENNCTTFLKILPFILACSLTVANENDNFKPEYILPQLLLHLIVVRHQEDKEIEGEDNAKIKLEGIEYTSTAANNELEFINKDSATTFHLTDCLVLPVKIPDDPKEQYCKDLIRKFWLTSPRYYETEYIRDSLAFIKNYMSSLSIKDNKLILPNNSFMRNYDASYFSFIEKSWKESDFKSLQTKIY